MTSGTDHTGDAPAERQLSPALRRGFGQRCPACGQGHILHRYLKLRDRCPSCDEDLGHARADDGPAYLTILIVGHLMAPIMHVTFTAFRPPPLVLATVFCTLCVALSLFLLPRIKGAIVGFQWARRMHGF